ncbi:type IV toxin-antitoxin system AbiEi family antitoxin domain-containing protein [Mycolicibacterium arseniciresistens]|uniref:Type IV toxin-antitoxin system AbiEi family antitoxin domain-containing protein n=1 Tax=Mycolicibacterium arseniciresistens TaxID=3062257 RepID=A0ABT8UKG5_9MYCO|nr:type IV toxin-antitoxin system AbiEi family antitoxin domain-containing protein [Mycolicibacterium arseniciresistens]MDO3638271.1 type IV toxin-antitoxin system AbiEi family antitoxin domain-containing protein [Mycolicibacterium arseniciresistens]
MLDDILRRQDGVLTLRQALCAGLSQDAVDRRVRSGHWRRCARGVYFVDDRPFTDSARVRAAVWGYGARAAASGLAAAWWHGLTKFAPEVVEVTIPRAQRRSHLPSTRLRRRDLRPADVVAHRGLQVTALPLTVVEAAVRRGGGPKILDSSLQRHVELRGLWTAHLRNKGRHGSPAARRLLQVADDGARSEAERLLIRLLKAARLTGWKANHPVAGYRVDVAFPNARVAIEVDGFAFHSDSDDFHADRVRQNAISLAGWQVLRFTWLDLTEHPQRVIAEIRRAIARP